MTELFLDNYLGLTEGKLRYDLITGLKLYVLIYQGLRRGDAIPDIRGLEDQGSGTAPKRNVSRVWTEGVAGHCHYATAIHGQ